MTSKNFPTYKIIEKSTKNVKDKKVKITSSWIICGKCGNDHCNWINSYYSVD